MAQIARVAKVARPVAATKPLVASRRRRRLARERVEAGEVKELVGICKEYLTALLIGDCGWQTLSVSDAGRPV